MTALPKLFPGRVLDPKPSPETSIPGFFGTLRAAPDLVHIDPAIRQRLRFPRIWPKIPAPLLATASQPDLTSLISKSSRFDADSFEHRLLQRISLGSTVADLEHIAEVGPRQVLEEQLHPEELDDSGLEAFIEEALPTLTLTPFERLVAFNDEPSVPLFEFWAATVLRAIYTPRQLQERMVVFWTGADGLTLCVPFGEPNYYTLRPTLAIAPPDSSDPNRATNLDGFFGLPPAMTPLLEAYQDGALAFVHACGLPSTTRSHFDAMHFMEIGIADPVNNKLTGWLGRHLQATAPTLEDGVLRAVGIGAGLQRTLVGGPKTLPIGDFEGFGLSGSSESLDARRDALQAMYAAVPDPLGASARGTFDTIDLLEQIDFASYQPSGGAVYPEGELGIALKSVAALIKAEMGVEAAAVDLGGWDTHDFQAPIDGATSIVMGSLAEAIAAFHKDLFADDFTNVTLVAMSEFGRNAFENGSAGTDHGHGGLMMVLGGNVDGGRIVADWPGLAPGQLFEDQDLAVTIDYRDILTEILTKRAENSDITTVFTDPSYVPVDRGVING